MHRHDHPPKVASAYSVVKRLCDVAISLSALAILGLPMLAVAVLIALQDGGGPLFRQIRVGRGCRPFEMLKFRSMVVDAEERGGFTTRPGDTRITPLGLFLRRTSIDELPQLINVLKGEMSLIGPRPDVPAQQADYPPGAWRRRHEVRPGLTGLAQASDRSLLAPERRAALDLQYVEEIGIALDLKIVVMTVGQILKGSST
jgi:lipopolysaccharide/colanic/teichoic acid biosynthesis glycosyltransferase